MISLKSAIYIFINIIINGEKMSKLKTMLYVLLASVATSPLFASSSDWAGPYIGVQGSIIGVELEGTHNDRAGDITNGAVGKFAMIGGLDIGYAIPMGENGFIDIGGSYVAGEAAFKHDNVGNSNADVTFTAENLMSVYIQPNYAVSDSSAIFFKIGYSEAETSVSGDVTKPGDLKGTTYAIGTKSLLPSGLFVKTEAGFTEYDEISSTGLSATQAAGKILNSVTVKAEPTIAYGAITIGMKF